MHTGLSLWSFWSNMFMSVYLNPAVQYRRGERGNSLPGWMFAFSVTQIWLFMFSLQWDLISCLHGVTNLIFVLSPCKSSKQHLHLKHALLSAFGTVYKTWICIIVWPESYATLIKSQELLWTTARTAEGFELSFHLRKCEWLCQLWSHALMCIRSPWTASITDLSRRQQVSGSERLIRFLIKIINNVFHILCLKHSIMYLCVFHNHAWNQCDTISLAHQKCQFLLLYIQHRPIFSLAWWVHSSLLLYIVVLMTTVLLGVTL